MKRLVSISLCFYLMWATFNVVAQTNIEKELVIGSKNFTENIILAEIATQLVRAREGMVCRIPLMPRITCPITGRREAMIPRGRIMRIHSLIRARKVKSEK